MNDMNKNGITRFVVPPRKWKPVRGSRRAKSFLDVHETPSRFMHEEESLAQDRQALRERQELHYEEEAKIEKFFSQQRVSAGRFNDKSRNKEHNPRSFDSDARLVQDLRNALKRDASVAAAVASIQVTAKNGIVTLKGTVLSEQEQMIIEDKAVALAGFCRVINHLEIIGY